MHVLVTIMLCVISGVLGAGVMYTAAREDMEAEVETRILRAYEALDADRILQRVDELAELTHMQAETAADLTDILQTVIDGLAGAESRMADHYRWSLGIWNAIAKKALEQRKDGEEAE